MFYDHETVFKEMKYLPNMYYEWCFRIVYFLIHTSSSPLRAQPITLLCWNLTFCATIASWLGLLLWCMLPCCCSSLLPHNWLNINNHKWKKWSTLTMTKPHRHSVLLFLWNILIELFYSDLHKTIHAVHFWLVHCSSSFLSVNDISATVCNIRFLLGRLW